MELWDGGGLWHLKGDEREVSFVFFVLVLFCIWFHLNSSYFKVLKMNLK